MKAREGIVETFANEGVDTVFTLMSEEIIGLISEIQDNQDGMRVVHCRHEQGAALMADGHSRIDGAIGVCITGRGPAIAQTGTALKAADNYGSRVLYLVPESRRNTSHDGKGFQQEAYLRMMAGEVESIRSPEILLSSLSDVFRRLHAGEGPIAVQVPTDVLEADLPDDEVPPPGDRSVGAQDARIEPDPAKIEEAVDTYLDSDATKAPVILAGRGAIRAGAKGAIERLAERMEAYLATSLQGMGYFADHPYNLGFTGDLGANLANEHLIEADFVLALGCSLNHHTVDAGELLRDDAKVVHVDTNPAHIDRYTDVDVGIVADAKTAAEAFEAELADLGIERSGEFWTDRARERFAETTSVSDREFEEVPGTVDPRDLVGALDGRLPDERFVMTDVGHFCSWLFDGLTIDPTDHHNWAIGFLALGQALPLGMGAALAEEERTCITFCGDGGLMMILQELDTAARYGVPLIVVVFNDEALGAEYHMAQIRGFSGEAGKMRSPDFAALATDLGAEGYTVRSVDDVTALADTLNGDLSGPVVVDCKVNPEAVHRSMGNMDIE